VAARAERLGKLPFGFGPRFFVALVLGFLWLIPAWREPRFIAAMFLWDGLVLAAWIADLLRLPAASLIEARRGWDRALSLGHAAVANVELHNHSGVPVYASVVDHTPLTLRDAPASLAAVVPAGGFVQLDYPLRPGQRGDLSMGRMFLRYRTSLGLAERWASAGLEQKVRVLPDLEQARNYALYLIRSRQVDMEKRRRRQRGMGREFEALREYRQGDEMRDVYWPATARRHQLISRTYQVERSQAVWIVLDAGRLLRAQVYDAARGLSVSKLDYAVDAALSLAQVAAQSGDRVGLLAYGRNIQQSVGTGRGAPHVRTLVNALAMVRGEAPEADHGRAVRTLLRVQTRRSLIVWVTDFAETATTPEVIEHAMHMTRRHLVVFAAMSQPDLIALTKAVPQSEDEMFRHTAALEIAQRRERLMRGLRERGVLAVDLVPGELAGSLINQYLEIKDRSLL
jgi:uncharacterized protein (DUF58 family)